MWKKTFKLLYEETNNEVKLNHHLKEDMTAVYRQTWKGCGKNQVSYFKIQDPHRSGELCTWWKVLYVQSIETDSHQCRHLTKWALVQYYSTIWQLILPFLYALSFNRLHTTCKRFSLPMPWRHKEGVKVQFQPFLTLALDGGEWLSSCHGCFTPWERTPLPINREAGYTLVWTFWRREKSLAPTWIRTLGHLAVKCCYTHYAILPPSHPWAHFF